MRRRLVVASMILVSMSLGACSVSPPARFEAYLGPASVQGRGQEPDRLALPSGRLEAGLLVLNDTTHPGSAPPLSDPRLAALSRRIQDQVEQHFPITVTEVLPASGIAPAGDVQQFDRLAKKHETDYLLLVIVSSSESEIPVRLPLGGASRGAGGRGLVPGYRAKNFALVEVNLLEARTGRIVVQAHGRDWASLHQLNIPIESNLYPVVRRSFEVAPIYPTSDEAYDTLRAIASEEALEQALWHLRDAWPRAVPT